MIYPNSVLLLLTIVPLLCNGQETCSRFQYTAPLMGTTFKLTFYTHSPEHGKAAAAAAFSRIEELNNIFSDYSEDSEGAQLSKTSGSGKRVTVSDDLWHLLKLSKKFSRQTKGAFDITIGPLSKLWRRAIRQQEFPGENKISQARSRVNYRWIKLYPRHHQVKLQKPYMQLDFGGIAKGYAIDEAFKVLERYGIDRALVEGGGDLYLGASPPRGQSWTIKLHNGQSIEDQAFSAVASSGDTFQFLLWEGKRYSHIVDPFTGLGVVDRPVITVRASRATIADAVASSLIVMSEKSRKKILKKNHALLLEPSN